MISSESPRFRRHCSRRYERVSKEMALGIVDDSPPHRGRGYCGELRYLQVLEPFIFAFHKFQAYEITLPFFIDET